MTYFMAAEHWKTVHPGASAGFLVLTGLENPAAHAELDARKHQLEEDIRQTYAGLDRKAIEALPVIQAYNQYYKRFKKSYHVQLQLESIAFKDRSLPGVAALVEAMFMAEVKNLLLTAGHDLDTLSLPVTIDSAAGTEQYTLMRGEEQLLKEGDMFIADGAGVISSIIYGPDRRTAIHAGTKQALFTVYAPPGIDPLAVRAHLEEIDANVRLFCPQAERLALEVCSSF